MGIAADFVLIVVAGLIGGMLARFLRMPLLVGYVAAGVFVGPHTAGPTVVQIKDVETLAEIGVALLLFSIGLEISFRDLRAVRRVALIGGPIQILGTMAVAAGASVFALGSGWIEALWIGAMISVSSTMVVLKILAAGGVSSTLASRVMIGLLLVQDLAVIPMLIILPQLGRAEDLAWRVLSALALAAVLLAGVYFAGTRLLPPLFRRILAWGTHELFLVAVVAVGIGIGAAMHAAGFAFALGAFVAGLILSESDFSHQALSDVVPLRDIFGLLFFVTVGMLFDPSYAIRNVPLILAMTAVIIAGKSLVAGVIARGFGYRFHAPWIIGLGLSQIGEFSFVLARTGLSGNFISKPVYDLILTATVVTMALSPLVSPAALPLGRWWRARRGDDETQVPAPEAPAPQMANHVVVAGYGRTGRAVAKALREAGIECIVIESSYALIGDVREDGFAGLWGDIAREEILRAAHAQEAQMLLLTMPDQSTVELAVECSRRLNPELVLVARCTRANHLRRLQELGVTAVQPEFEGGLEMVRLGLVRCGRAGEEVGPIIDNLRRDLYGGKVL
ncbi:MAG: portal protein [Acidobacteria bacterium]|nr:portal protein [Acidobacteriota bacterium]